MTSRRRSAAVLGIALAAAVCLPTASGSTHARPTSAAERNGAHAHKAPAVDAGPDRRIDVPGFGEVTLYRPKAAARGLALFASGDGGWKLGVTDMAERAASLGYWVAGFSTPHFLRALDDDGDACSDADGRLAQLGRDLVRRLELPPQTRPVLIGYSSGATLAYAALAADAGQHFGGGISLGFCPDLSIRKAFCPGNGGLTRHWQARPPNWVFDKRDTVAARWRILQGESDQVCDPRYAPEFAAGQRDSKAVMLPKVGHGHGFGVPAHWMPQYARSLQELLDAAPSP